MCQSCSLYGAPLWFLYGSAVKDLCIAWHKALRYVWNVPPQNHKTTALLSDSELLEISLKACFYKFAEKTICHKNKMISYVMKMSVSIPWSVVGRNYKIVSLKELINVRDVHQLCHVFTKDEVNMLIELLYVK